MDLRHPYLTEQLIAYIGNKRALIPFLYGVFFRLCPRPQGATFLDPFAGAGSVSRLARLMGFAVQANDWEPYSFVINSCHLGIDVHTRDTLFGAHGGLPAVMAELNALPLPSADASYISKNYAPRLTEEADWRTERLFYTQENALRIDAIRERIEEMYPGRPTPSEAADEKLALLAPLLYEAATHTNTSGVFKACHRGFGGHGRDALVRIMAPICLRPPVVVDGQAATVSCMDAGEFLRGRSAELCYLDPPYATHQYGSNYFMLNTIALWDKPPVSGARGADGRLLRKAGIREDWVKTRSEFCYPSTALQAMRRVVEAADCRWLVVSYSNEGLIGLEELCDLLSSTGGLSLHSTAYAKYPGGKQSLDRTTRNLECVLVVDRRARRSTRGQQDALLREVRIARLMGMAFDPRRVRASFEVPPDPAGVLGLRPRLGMDVIPMRHLWRFPPDAAPPRFDRAEDAESFIAALGACQVKDVREEIDVLLDVARGVGEPVERERLATELLRLLNRLAHRKNRGVFSEAFGALRGFSEGLEGAQRFRAGLEKISQTAAKRAAAGGFAGPDQLSERTSGET
jgi:adenine-specific DNA-methyltransferase